MAFETSILQRTFAGFLAIAVLTTIGTGPGTVLKHHGNPPSFSCGSFDAELSMARSETSSAPLALDRAALTELRRRLSAHESPGHQLLKFFRRLSPRHAGSDGDVEGQRLRAARLAATLGEPAMSLMPELILAFRTTRDWETREVIGKTWLKLGTDGVAAFALIALDSDPALRVEGLRGLGVLLPKIPCPASMRLDIAVLAMSQLSSAEVPVVVAATHALGGMGQEAGVAIPVLLRNLCHAAPAVRGATATVLGQIANHDPACVGPLTQLLSDAAVDVRYASATALAQFGALAAPAVPQLMEAWTTGSSADVLPAIHALGRIGPSAAPAVPELVTALGRAGQPAVFRSSVAAALGRIARQPESAIPALLRASLDADPGVQESAIQALGAFGPGAELAVPALIAALAEGSESRRVLAAEALGRIGPGARPAVPFLEAARNNNQSVMSGPVLAAIALIEPSGSNLPERAHGESSP